MPESLKTDLTIFSNKDAHPQMSIVNDRTMEIHGDTLNKTQATTNITNGFKAVVSSDSNFFSISGVDNTGASVSTSNTNKEMKILVSANNILNISIV